MKAFIRSRTFLLLVLFAIGIFLRFYLLWNNLFFGPEQGIDFLVIRAIVLQHKFTLIGPKTDIAGIFHGPIYYYLAAIPFAITHGDPVSIALFLLVIHCLTIFVIYLLGKELFTKATGILAAILFTISYGAIIYSRWLATHPLSFLFSSLFFLFFVKFLRGKSMYLPLAGIAFGLLCQTEFLNILFFSIILLLAIIIFSKQFIRQNPLFLLFSFLVFGFFTFGNYILFDMRHQFLMTKNLLLLLGGKTGYHVPITTSSVTAVSSFVQAFGFFVFPTNALIALLLLLFGSIALVAISKKNKLALLVLIWLWVPVLLLVALGHDILFQYFVASAVAIILTASVLVQLLWETSRFAGVAVAVVLIVVNCVMWGLSVPGNHNMFFQSTQPDLRFVDEKHVIDAIYQEANGHQFSFQAYTIPYWEQASWQYLFWQYGSQKYGYPPIDEKANTLFVIIQDDPSNTSFQQAWIANTVSTWGQEVSEKRFGIFRVKELAVR